MRFREPYSRRSSCFYVQNDFPVDPANETTAPRNLAQSSTQSKLTHDPNATGRQNVVNPNPTSQLRNSPKTGEQVSALQRHSL
jgi:hypothetical protein